MSPEERTRQKLPINQRLLLGTLNQVTTTFRNFESVEARSRYRMTRCTGTFVNLCLVQNSFLISTKASRIKLWKRCILQLQGRLARPNDADMPSDCGGARPEPGCGRLGQADMLIPGPGVPSRSLPPCLLTCASRHVALLCSILTASRYGRPRTTRQAPQRRSCPPSS